MQFSGGPIPDAARNLGQLRTARATWALVLTVTGIQACLALLGGVDALGEVYENLGLSRAGFMAGKIWQIGSYAFLHGGWMHVGLNAVFVLLIGSRIEHMTGSRGMLLATFAGIAGGGAGHLLLGPGLLVGLSGGCMGLLLLLTTLSPQSRMFPLPVSGRSLGLGVMIAELLLALLDPAAGLPGLSAAGRLMVLHGMGGWFQVGHACHFAGGGAGWIYGRWLLRPTVTLDRLRRDRARRETKC